MDTTLMDCKICEEEKDCIEGICEDCRYSWKMPFYERYINSSGVISGIAGEVIAYVEKEILNKNIK